MAVPFSNTHLRVPRGFGTLLEGLTREILRDQPEDIPKYAAQYFETLLKKRGESNVDPAEWAAKLEDRFYNNDAFKSTEEECSRPQRESIMDIPLDDPEANRAAAKIQAGVRGHMTRKRLKLEDKAEGEEEECSQPQKEEAIMDIPLDDPEANRAAAKIQAGFRGYMTRKKLKLEDKAGRDEEECSQPQKEEAIMDIPLDDPEANKAAAKIQAGFRGYMTRKKLKLQDKAGREEEECSQPQKEEAIMDIPLDDPEANRAAAKIQAGFRGYMTRKKLKLEDRAGGEEEEFSQRQNIINIPLDDPEANRAAAKIQAGVRGYMTRKKLKLEDRAGAEETSPSKETAAEVIISKEKSFVARTEEESSHSEEVSQFNVDKEEPVDRFPIAGEQSDETSDTDKEHNPALTLFDEVSRAANETDSSSVPDQNIPQSELEPTDLSSYRGLSNVDVCAQELKAAEDEEGNNRGPAVVDEELVDSGEEDSTEVAEQVGIVLYSGPADEDVCATELGGTERTMKGATAEDVTHVTEEEESLKHQPEDVLVESLVPQSEIAENDQQGAVDQPEKVTALTSGQYIADTGDRHNHELESVEKEVNGAKWADDLTLSDDENISSLNQHRTGAETGIKEHETSRTIENDKKISEVVFLENDFEKTACSDDPDFKEGHMTDMVGGDNEESHAEGYSEAKDREINDGGAENNSSQVTQSNTSMARMGAESEVFEESAQYQRGEDEGSQRTLVWLQPEDTVAEKGVTSKEAEELRKGMTDSEIQEKSDTMQEEETISADWTADEQQEEGLLELEEEATVPPESTDKEECSRPQEEEDIMDIPLDDPEANRAAAKIQAGFRGHMTRKKLKPEDKTEGEERQEDRGQ